MSEDSLNDLQTALDALKESVEKGDCDTIRKKIQELLEKAQPVQNRITTGDLQETNEQISKIKAEIRLLTSEVETKCSSNAPKKNVKANNAPANTKANNAPANNAKASNAPTNNTKANNAPANTKANNAPANTKANNAPANTKANNAPPATNAPSGADAQTGGKRKKTRRRRRPSRKA